jgi:REP element-mobilizing transposase RayT
MGQSLSKNYLHLVFSTKSHIKILDKNVSNELYRYISAILKSCNSPAITIGGTSDHVHILCVLSKNISTAKLLEEIKKSSSKWIKTKGDTYRHFKWQGGYASFSVSQSYVTSIKKYIENQELHHKKISFRNELLKLLDDYYIVYDKRYLWD